MGNVMVYEGNIPPAVATDFQAVTVYKVHHTAHTRMTGFGGYASEAEALAGTKLDDLVNAALDGAARKLVQVAESDNRGRDPAYPIELVADVHITREERVAQRDLDVASDSAHLPKYKAQLTLTVEAFGYRRRINI